MIGFGFGTVADAASGECCLIGLENPKSSKSSKYCSFFGTKNGWIKASSNAILLWGDTSSIFLIRSTATCVALGIWWLMDFWGNFLIDSSISGISGQSTHEGEPKVWKILSN